MHLFVKTLYYNESYRILKYSLPLTENMQAIMNDLRYVTGIYTVFPRLP